MSTLTIWGIALVIGGIMTFCKDESTSSENEDLNSSSEDSRKMWENRVYFMSDDEVERLLRENDCSEYIDKNNRTYTKGKLVDYMVRNNRK